MILHNLRTNVITNPGVHAASDVQVKYGSHRRTPVFGGQQIYAMEVTGAIINEFGITGGICL